MSYFEVSSFEPQRRNGAVPGGVSSPSPDTTARKAADLIFPQLSTWWPIFERLGISDEKAVTIAAAAERNGTTLKEEAVAQGHATAHDIARAVAANAGLDAQGEVDADALVLGDNQAAMILASDRPMPPLRVSDGADTRVLLHSLEAQKLTRRLREMPQLASRLRVVASPILRAALMRRVSSLLGNIATFDLFTRYPDYSARTVVNAWQGSVVGALAIGVPVAMWTWPTATFAVLHVVFSFFFLSCVCLRFAAVASGVNPPARAEEQPIPVDLPVYSVLVALYREAEIAGELVASLSRIAWPASKLDIKLVCEADDAETIAALKAPRPPSYMEIVEVPNFGPRTKPKALNYALQTCRGSLVVLYDAEDRPHPDQLIEAWQRFSTNDERLACLQAPLEIANGHRSWIARSFAFEYAALFRGLLPWLSQRRLMLPLGGTSNHFRRSALENVGRWDPFNVTEDADLGARLMRFGYRTETISLPTLEDAPETARVWIPQRTRWFKGWLQTWLVHMRNPAAFYRQLGPRSFLIAQVLFGGMVLSAAVHPVFIGTMSWVAISLATGHTLSTLQSSLLVVDTVNIIAGYVSFWMLGRLATPPDKRRGLWKVIAVTPLYWLMMSYAAWRSIVHLYRMPHLWEKTPHGAAARAPSRPAE
ncbi:MAG: glycosyltransferase [Rhizobiaceae bacterium]